MLVEFLMQTENMNTHYKVFGKRDGNVITFPDKSAPNTIMTVEIWEDEIEIKRSGEVNMHQSFKLDENRLGHYKNNSGISFNISSYTKKMQVSNNQIYLEYEYYLENEWQSSNKLKILF